MLWTITSDLTNTKKHYDIPTPLMKSSYLVAQDKQDGSVFARVERRNAMQSSANSREPSRRVLLSLK